MLPVNSGGHTAYQNFVTENLRKYYPNPNALARSTWDIIERFRNLDLSYTDELLADKYSKFGPAPRTPSYMQRSYLLFIDFKVSSLTQWAAQLESTEFTPHDQPYASLFEIYKREFLDISVSKELIHKDSLAIAGDGTPVVTSHRERKKRICKCKENGITDCNCDRYFPQPDCDIGWDSSRDCFYHGYDLYMLVDSESDLPIFPHYSCASRHDSHGFLHAFFRMKSFLPDFKVSKLLLDSAHDAMPYYEYCKRENITPFIDLNSKCVRTVHLVMQDNLRLFNDPPRSSKEWKTEYNARTSAERSNKREKIDFQLESGRHRSTKMWYCRLYHIMMLQHLDAWDMPSESPLRKLILDAA